MARKLVVIPNRPIPEFEDLGGIIHIPGMARGKRKNDAIGNQLGIGSGQIPDRRDPFRIGVLPQHKQRRLDGILDDHIERGVHLRVHPDIDIDRAPKRRGDVGLRRLHGEAARHARHSEPGIAPGAPGDVASMAGYLYREIVPDHGFGDADSDHLAGRRVQPRRMPAEDCGIDRDRRRDPRRIGGDGAEIDRGGAVRGNLVNRRALQQDKLLQEKRLLLRIGHRRLPRRDETLHPLQQRGPIHLGHRHGCGASHTQYP